ncbi:hypothetical protein [Rickettsiella massiliensis]|uniref:hypothetical protein n=1 Tax=Rickettsiella massiliensis TaxID=676517 RepID=UPI000299D870|nr:hypothetical protein [Rickettsiella massiliensis]
MARIRTIKPEFWTSAQVVSCSPIARLLFIGLWSFADDNGVNKACLPSLKMKVFPNDLFTTKDIEQWISELINVGLMQLYEAEGNTYWHITGWKRHQRIDRPTTRYPLPPDLQVNETTIKNEQVKFVEDSSRARRIVGELSASNQRLIDDPSVTEWKGMEGNGKDIYIREAEASPRPINMANVSLCEQLFKHWQQTMNHPKAKLDKKRRKTINQALETYTVEDLKKAIDGCSKTAFNMGQNDNKQRYDDIELILRDSAHIDRFIHQSEATNTPATCYIPESMQGVI